MQTRQWQDQEGQTRYLSEVIANDIIILDTRRDSIAQDDAASAPVAEPPSPAPPAQNQPAAGKTARASATDMPAARSRTSPTTPTRAAKVAALPRGTAALEEEDLPF